LALSPRPPKPRELAQEMQIKQTEYRSFRLFLKNAVKTGELERLRGGRLAVPSYAGKLKGRLIVAKSGIGFVVPEDKGEEIFVSEDELGGAFHGEQVMVELKNFKRGKSREGRVVKVLNREGAQLVGKLEKTRQGWLLHPDDPRIQQNIGVENPANLLLKPDFMAVIVLYEWRADYLPPVGKVTEILGPAGSPGVDIDHPGFQLNFLMQLRRRPKRSSALSQMRN
jgi:ribonuclease R